MTDFSHQAPRALPAAMTDKTQIEAGSTDCEVHIVADSMVVLRRALIEALHRVDNYISSRTPPDAKEAGGSATLNMKLGNVLKDKQIKSTAP